MAAEIEKVRMVIHQPRLDHLDEEVLTVKELENFGEAVRDRIADIEGMTPAERLADEVPGEEQCRFCKRKPICKAYEQMVFEAVAGDFVDLSDPAMMTAIAHNAAEEVTEMGDNRLAVAMAAVPMIEQWCLAVRAKVEAELVANKHVPGFKLVRGRMGNREWQDEVKAVKELKGAGLTEDQMYKKKLATPPAVEKLVKAGVVPASQWIKLQKNITQSEGALSVAPLTDKRPAVSVTADASEFTDES
jgi:hypothetical protein